MAGRPSFEFTDEIKNEIKHLARCAMNLDFIADSIGCSTRTMQNHPEIMQIYNDEYTKIVSKISESLLARALEPNADSALLIFVMKTRAKWKDDRTVKIPDFEGTMVDKLNVLDQHLKEGLLTEETYARLTSALVGRWKAEDHEARLLALEQEDQQAANNSNIAREEKQ